MTTPTLPHQSTLFIGRAEELAQIDRSLADPDCCLLTLVGAGGVGKTRLALRAGAGQIPHFAQGVYFVPLNPVSSSDLLVDAIASALQVSFDGSEVPRLQLIRYLREKQLLLIMDNFEHLLEASDLLTDILQSATRVKFLVTSRERLNLREEWVLTLEGLSYPDDRATQPLETYSAVQLFLQRARQVQANFSLTENAEAVMTLCQQVEGSPLAIELATTWLRAMSCRQITTRIAGSLDFLITPLRNVPERHRSLFAVFEQSWTLLSPAEQGVLMRLAIFRGGFDLEAAEQVAGASPVFLAGLVDKSLVRLNADGRYDLHDLLRQYAGNILLEAGEADLTAQRHDDYFLKLAEGAAAHAFGHGQVAWFDRLEVELDNLRAALARSVEAETGLQMAAALGWFYSERSHWKEGLDWLEQMLTANPDAFASLRAQALHSAGALAGLLGDERQARAYCEQALTLARSADDRWNIAWSLSHLGNYTAYVNPNQRATHLDESLAMFRVLDDAMGITHTLIRRAWVAHYQEDYPYNRRLAEEALRHAREAGDKIMSAWATNELGRVAWQQDHDYEQARTFFESSAALFREAHSNFPNPLVFLANIEQAMGNSLRAQRLYEEALISQQSLPRGWDLSWIFGALASVTRSLGQLERAAHLLGIAHGMSLSFEHVTSDLPDFEEDVASVRDQLGETAFAEAWAVGSAMTQKQAIAYALEGRSTPTEATLVVGADKADAGQIRQAAPLKARELEVLKLVADGFSNAEIAQALVLAPSTVKWYVHELFSKLGVTNRTQAGVRARELGLLS